jgi:hypothetical protein
MKYQLSNDARPQAMTLMLAAFFRLRFGLFPSRDSQLPISHFRHLHSRRRHALAALATGNSVQSLSVAMNGSGETIRPRAV